MAKEMEIIIDSLKKIRKEENLNGELEVSVLSKGNYFLRRNNKSYHVEVLHASDDVKEMQLRINGKLVHVQIKEAIDLLAEKMGFNNISESKSNKINSPMPGLVLEIPVKEGDSVTKDQPVIILEAMKMENILKSPKDAVIASVHCAKGDSVEKNQLLLEFE